MVGLPTIIKWDGIRVFRGEAVVDGKNWHAKFDRPLSCVALVTRRGLRNESAAVDVNYHFVDRI